MTTVRMGLVHNMRHTPSHAASRRRFALGEAGGSMRPRSHSRRSTGGCPKKRSAAVVPSGRRGDRVTVQKTSVWWTLPALSPTTGILPLTACPPIAYTNLSPLNPAVSGFMDRE